MAICVLLNFCAYAYAIRRAQAAEESGGDLYNCAHSAIEKAVAEINRFLSERESQIESLAVEKLKNVLKDESRIYYKDGSFHLLNDLATKEEDLYYSIFKEEAGVILESFLTEYSTVSDDGQAQAYASFDAQSDEFSAGSVAEGLELEADLEWLAYPHEEEIRPSFAWKSEPLNVFAKSLAAGGSASFEGGAQSGGTSQEGLRDDISSMIRMSSEVLTQRKWTRENPVVIGRSLNIDVSDLYDGDNAIPSCIINLSSDLYLYASSSAKSHLNAVIFTMKDIHMQNITFSGTAISLQNAYVTGYGTPLSPDPDMLFKIYIADWELHKSILDFYGASSFKGARNGEDLDAILKWIKIDDFSMRLTPALSLEVGIEGAWNKEMALVEDKAKQASFR
jgi:hypothetical protein